MPKEKAQDARSYIEAALSGYGCPPALIDEIASRLEDAEETAALQSRR